MLSLSADANYTQNTCKFTLRLIFGMYRTNVSDALWITINLMYLTWPPLCRTFPSLKEFRSTRLVFYFSSAFWFDAIQIDHSSNSKCWSKFESWVIESICFSFGCLLLLSVCVLSNDFRAKLEWIVILSCFNIKHSLDHSNHARCIEYS